MSFVREKSPPTPLNHFDSLKVQALDPGNLHALGVFAQILPTNFDEMSIVN